MSWQSVTIPAGTVGLLRAGLLEVRRVRQHELDHLPADAGSRRLAARRDLDALDAMVAGLEGTRAGPVELGTDSSALLREAAVDALLECVERIGRESRGYLEGAPGAEPRLRCAELCETLDVIDALT